MKNIYRFIVLLGLLLAHGTIMQGQNVEDGYLRGDANVQFRWRFGYSEYPIDKSSQTSLEDVVNGKYAWYNGILWSGAYKDWEDRTIHGVSLLFRGGSPYARTVRCISEVVPFSQLGTAKTFVIPLSYGIGSEERISFALTVAGQESETVIMNLAPKKKEEVTSGNIKVSFHALRVDASSNERPMTKVMGLLYIRVYPTLLKYGNRMTFEFNSLTRHMDVESSMCIGSLWKDLSKTNLEDAWKKSGLTIERLEIEKKLHDEKMQAWDKKVEAISKNLDKEGLVEISYNSDTEIWDRGECRVQAYSGNPVKDYQYGTVTDKMEKMALSVTSHLKKNFSLFRYQHHQLPWKEENPALLDSSDVIYMDQWLKVAALTADKVVLDMQISPVTKAYKEASKMGSLPLPVDGVPGYTWKDLTLGYQTAIRHAKKVCPQLKIIQMPYEYDNISGTECHKDAHYNIFKCLYTAVNEVNKELQPEDQLEVAGLGSNTPHHWDFIEGFLKRYHEDPNPHKRLDYITWHNYLFPGTAPNIAKGFKSKIDELLKKYSIDPNLKILIDESGLAEPSTIEDLSDLEGASKKEAAMACFTSTVHHWYLQEKGNFIPITGGGFHFGLLTYGNQNVLSPYAKGMLLRNSLFDNMQPSITTPCDENGYGLYSQATIDKDEYRILVWTASPSIFYEKASLLAFPDAKIVLKDLPASMNGNEVDVEIEAVDPEDPNVLAILRQEKCQTLPLTRGADRYEIDFTDEEVRVLNSILIKQKKLRVEKRKLVIPMDIRPYSMYLLKFKL